jgi:hypothetical protein
MRQSLLRARDIQVRGDNVRFWHLADIEITSENVRSLGQSGHHVIGEKSILKS